MHLTSSPVYDFYTAMSELGMHRLRDLACAGGCTVSGLNLDELNLVSYIPQGHVYVVIS